MRPGTLIRREAFSLRRYEQRLERSETTTSNSPGTTGMAATAHRAGDTQAHSGQRHAAELCVSTHTTLRDGRSWPGVGMQHLAIGHRKLTPNET